MPPLNTMHITINIRQIHFPTPIQFHYSPIKPIFTKIHLPKISDKPRYFSIFTRLAPKSLHSLSAMAGESESFSITTDAAAKYGFERDEMYKLSLAGSVEPYDRHLFLSYKSHELWPARVESSDSDPLPKLLDSAIKARKNDISVKTRLTICEGGDDVKLSDGDVLAFPEMILYRGLKESDVDSFVDDVLVNGKPWASGVQEEISGSYVFVCAHNNRDQRCGVCGPVLIKKFKEEIELKGWKNKVYVTACSHVGGHKYAGNMITFSADPEGKIAGNWYGYVTPNDVLELLNIQIGKGEVIERIWRGKMGAPVVEVKKVDEVKLANGTNGTSNEKQPREVVTEEKTESVAGCCQGANGFSCCRDENAEKKPVKKGLGGLSCWTEKLEQRQVLTTVALVGAVTAIAVAYSLYRRAR